MHKFKKEKKKKKKKGKIKRNLANLVKQTTFSPICTQST